MRRLVVSEHARIERGYGAWQEQADHAYLDAHLYDRLRAFDRATRDAKERVFDWSDGFARTTQWVGVVQVPGAQVEILPKIDTLAEARPGQEAEDARYEARRNLLYMLSVGGDVPVRSRDVARLAVRKAPLSETLAAIFASRLQRELLRGPERAYQQLEDNLRSFKGKLLVARQAVHNAGHRERFFCRYDEYSDDTLMNRIFRASCRFLLEVTRTPGTQDVLRQCLLLLDGVTDAAIQDADFGRVQLNRQNERFEDVLRFSRLLLCGRTPTVQAGGTRTFSLLFDMNKVFERFVVAFLQRYVAPRLDDTVVVPHAGRHKRHLMESDGVGVLRLEPDVLVRGPGNQQLVMDTKWKLLRPSARGRGGVKESDLYQLYAYARRYGCDRSVLLYPFTAGLEPRDFDVLDAGGQRRERIAVRHVHLHRNLQLDAERTALADELEAILREEPHRAAGGGTALHVGGAA